jgi:hypothetical protein
VTRGVVDRMMEYEWLGNVRELKNTIEEMVIFAQGRRLLDVGSADHHPAAARFRLDALPVSVGMSMNEIERAALEATLRPWATTSSARRRSWASGSGLYRSRRSTDCERADQRAFACEGRRAPALGGRPPQGISEVILVVKDVARSFASTATWSGCRGQRRQREVRLVLGGPAREIAADRDHHRASPRRGARRPLHFAFGTEDARIEELKAALERHGLEVEGPVSFPFWGEIDLLSDPDGNRRVRLGPAQAGRVHRRTADRGRAPQTHEAQRPSRISPVILAISWLIRAASSASGASRAASCKA